MFLTCRCLTSLGVIGQLFDGAYREGVDKLIPAYLLGDQQLHGFEQERVRDITYSMLQQAWIDEIRYRLEPL